MEKKLKILHLEDSSSDAELVNRVLKKGDFDFERLLVDTEAQFLSALDNFTPDLILSDHSLPSFNSHEALAIFRERKLKIPFILITSNVSEEFAVDVIKKGADDYILKDRLERLPSAIHNALEKYRLETEKQSYLYELIKNERHYRALIENGADVLVVLTAEGKPKYVSPSIKNVLGYTEAEALTLDLFEILHPDDREAVGAKLAECLQKPGVPVQGHLGRIKNKKGDWIWLEATLTNMLHDPAINGIVDNFRDVTERVNAEKKVSEIELFSKDILSSLSSQIAVIDKSGTIVAVNKAWDDFAFQNGVTALERTSKGANYFSVCEHALAQGDEISGEALAGIKSVFSGDNESYELEYSCHSPNQRRWFMLRVMRFGTDGTKVVTSHQDITSRKLAEEKAMFNELKFRGLIENSADGMAILSAEGIPLYVSPSIKNVLGYTVEEGMKLDLLGIAHPEDAHVLVSLMKKAIANPGTPIVGGPTRMRHKNNSWRWVEGVITNMLHEPSINGIVDNFRDITDRVQAEKAIIDSEERYRSFFENSTDGIALAITDGEIFAANPAACKMFRMTEQEICQAGRLGLVHSSEHPRVAEAIKKRREKGQATIEINFVRKDGSIFPGEITTVEFKDNTGAGRTSLIVRDRSERKLAEEKILHANRLYAFISQINQTIVHVKDDKTLFDEACRIAIEYGKFKLAWIGIPDVKAKMIRSVAGCGMTSYQEDFFSEYFYEPNGPIGKVITGQDYAIVASIKDEVKTKLSELADKSGLNSVIVLPIKKNNKLYATFNIYSSEAHFFDEQETALLQEATSDISFALDVFEKEIGRTLAEKSLQESQAKLVEAQELAKIGSWETDLQTLQVTWSEQSYRIFEVVENSQLTHSSFLEFIHQQDRDKVDEAFMKSLSNERLHTIEHRIITGKGNEKYILESWQIVHDVNGLAVRAVGTAQDITERKLAEEKLKETEFKYRQIVETAQEGIWLIDADDNTIFANDKLCQILQYSKNEIIGKKPFAFMDAEGKDISIKSLESKRNGISGQSDFKYIAKSGKEVWASVSATPFYDVEGKYSGSLAMLSDITEKRALEQLLERATTLARIGTYEADLINNTLYWSSMTREIHEVDDDFVPDLQSAINFYKPGANRELITRAVKTAIESNTAFDMEMQIITAKGNERWVRAIGEAECRNGGCTRLYGSFQDIDKLKVVETEIIKIYGERNSILESIDDAFFAVDKDWIISYWNNKAETVLGLSRETVLHQELWEVFPRAKEIFYDFFTKAITENKAQRMEFHADKKLHIWLDVNAYPASNGLSVFFKDITERKISETRLYDLNQNLQSYTNELLVSNKGMEQFSYVISHNLRAPVANLLGLAEELKDTTHDEETKQFLSVELINNARRLDNVILDLNSILQIKSELSELKETVFLGKLINDIKSSISNLISKENVEIITTGIEVDEFFTLKSFFYSIFYNLISNSIKYRQPGKNPVIEINSRSEDGRLILSVKDNGRGLNLTKHKDQVFGLYKRFHTNIEGKGMGLFMVKTQVEVLGGTVAIASEIDKGTEFTLTFNI